jgi:hypothetical protein
MPNPRPSTDAVLNMALAVARKQASHPTGASENSEEMRAAIAQVWALVKGRLPASSVETLDPLIRVIVGRQAAGSGQ